MEPGIILSFSGVRSRSPLPHLNSSFYPTLRDVIGNEFHMESRHRHRIWNFRPKTFSPPTPVLVFSGRFRRTYLIKTSPKAADPPAIDGSHIKGNNPSSYSDVLRRNALWALTRCQISIEKACISRELLEYFLLIFPRLSFSISTSFQLV